nr:MATE family efflux transporter [Altericroceibacterium spongiae]
MGPDNPELIAEAVRLNRICFPFLGTMALVQVLNGVFRGAGSTRQAMTISIAMQWLLQLPSAALLSLATALGVLGVWWSYPIANSGAALLCLIWLAKGPWRKNLVRPAGEEEPAETEASAR